MPTKENNPNFPFTTSNLASQLIKKGLTFTAYDTLGSLWIMVRDAPRKTATRYGEFIVQMIDEFQFLNARIYRDRAMTLLADDLAAGYLGTTESKMAPLLVSGSWVGWLMNLLTMMLPARFKFRPLENMPHHEAVEMIFKYSRFFSSMCR